MKKLKLVTTSKLTLVKKGREVGDWRVIKKVGIGAFGAVYRVSNVDTKQECAMKVERTDAKESMIRMEVAVLKTFRNSLWPHPHICDYVDSGLDAELNLRYVVMRLAGPNLSDLRRHCPRNRYSESTTIRLGIQCLRSLESLHRIGFIHRDVKAPNYAIGAIDARRIVFLLDFGLARQYVDRNGLLRAPRKRVGFRGTVRYASINSHLKHDLGRHDDLWSLLYMLVELQAGKLPWRKVGDKEKVGEMKRVVVADVLLAGMASEFHQILNELQGLSFFDEPNYDYFYDQLNSIMTRCKYEHEAPFDWETAGMRMRGLVTNPFGRHKKHHKAKKEKYDDEEQSRLSIKL